MLATCCIPHTTSNCCRTLWNSICNYFVSLFRYSRALPVTRPVSICFARCSVSHWICLIILVACNTCLHPLWHTESCLCIGRFSHFRLASKQNFALVLRLILHGRTRCHLSIGAAPSQATDATLDTNTHTWAHRDAHTHTHIWHTSGTHLSHTLFH